MNTRRQILRALGTLAVLGATVSTGLSQTSPVGTWDIVLRGGAKNAGYSGTAKLTFKADQTLDGFYILSGDQKIDLNPRGPTGGDGRTGEVGGNAPTDVKFGGANMQGFWTLTSKKVAGVINGIYTLNGLRKTNAMSFTGTVKGRKLNLAGKSSDLGEFTFSGVPYITQPSLEGSWSGDAERNGRPFIELLTLVRDTYEPNSYYLFGAGPGYYLKGIALQSAQKQMSLYAHSLSQPVFADPAILPASMLANLPPYMVTEIPGGGIIWFQDTDLSKAHLNDVAYGGEIAVAVGEGGVILNSYSGTTWIQRDSGVLNSLEGVAYGNGMFVAVGADGRVLNSPDGVQWTTNYVGAPSGLAGIAYGNPRFVAVGARGYVFTSIDGTIWSRVSATGTSNNLNRIDHTGSGFIAVGDFGTILRSRDGLVWSRDLAPVAEGLYGVGHAAPSAPVIVGTDGTILVPNPGATLTSTTIIVPVTNAITTNVIETTYLVITGSGGVPGAGFTIFSDDTGLPFATGNFDNGGNLSYFQPLQSTNTIAPTFHLPDWFTINSPASGTTLRDVVFDGSQYVAVGAGGKVITSPFVPPILWTERFSGSANSLNAVAANESKGQVIAVGNQGSILASTDGTSWALIAAATDPNGTLLNTVTGPLKNGSAIMRGVEGSGSGSSLTNILYRATKQ